MGFLGVVIRHVHPRPILIEHNDELSRRRDIRTGTEQERCGAPYESVPPAPPLRLGPVGTVPVWVGSGAGREQNNPQAVLIVALTSAVLLFVTFCFRGSSQ
jgi:hypothetical protein